jgi:transcriptional regulator with XRE-family HTH domain
MFRIKKICKDRGISLAELANLMGTTPESVSRTLGDDANPTIKTLAKFAKALDVQVYELFDNSDEDIQVRGYLEVGDNIHRINNFNDLQTIYNKLTAQK